MARNWSKCLVTYLMPISEYMWTVMVLYLTNLNYITELEQNPTIDLGYRLHTPV